MYFWNISQLKKDLKESPLPESENLKYLLPNIALYGVWWIPFWISTNIWDLYSALLMIIIMIVGTYYLYLCNHWASGKDFLSKQLSISWVVGIRWTVLLFLPSLILYGIVMESFGGGIPENTTWIDMIFQNFLYTIAFWLIGKHMKDVA